MSTKPELTHLTREQIADGKAVARAAHVGDWAVFDGFIQSAGGTFVANVSCQEDRQHIIWFNPKRALQLLGLIEYLQAEVERLSLAPIAYDQDNYEQHFGPQKKMDQ